MKDKKILSMMIIAVSVVVIFIVIMIIIFSISGRRLSFEKVEDKMKNAAIKYYSTREDDLPNTNGSSKTIEVKELSSNNYMKELNKIVPKGANCSGSVIVTKTGSNYLYSPVLNCGTDYSSTKFVSLLTNTKNIVTSGTGLYEKENGYLFKGENPNNLVKLGDTLWAIIDIDSNGDIRLININVDYKVKTVWDDRTLNSTGYADGKNDYYLSKIESLLIGLEKDNNYLQEEYKSYIVPKKWCIGKRSESNTAINNNEECSELSDEQMFGLPYVSDAYVASFDADCNSTADPACDNYNYLSEYALSSWTMTGVKENNTSAYYIVSAASVPLKVSSSQNIMPTIYISGNAIYASGDGSIESPYILK